MKKKSKEQSVKRWAFIFTLFFCAWLLLFMLVTTNVIPFSRCGSWEGEPWVSHCDAPYWEGWNAVPIWLGILAFLGAIFAFVGLIRAHTAQRSGKK